MNPALSFTFTENPRSDIVTSLCQAIPSFLLPWQVGSTLDNLQRIPDGAAVGCEDGSLYFFRSVNTTSLPRRSSTGSLSRRVGSSDAGRLASALSSRHLSQLKLRTPRSSSPASTKSTFSPFQLTKSRVVSSVSAEQVEAPKNYVDFEDEQEKLKGLIKRRGVKDKNVVDSLGPGVEITLIPEKSPGTSTSPSAAQSISDLGSKEFPSFARSRASSTESLSSPSSPTAAPFVPYPEISDPSLWSLICHTVPPRCGPSEIITAMKALEARHMIVCLHQSGYIEVYSTQDGTCLAAANVEDGHFSPPPGTKANSKLPVIWKWKSLHVASIAEQGFLLLACASPKATTSTLQSLESNEADREEETRIVAFQVQVSREGGPDGIMLKKMGDWSLDGYAESVELIAENDGQLALLHINSSRHFIRQKLSIMINPPTPQSLISRSSSNIHLPLPNPFKTAMKGLKSSDDLEAEVDEDDGIIRLNELIDLRSVALNSPISAVRCFYRGDVPYAFVWSNRELLIFDLGEVSARIELSMPLNGIRDVRWNGNDNFTVLFVDRADVYSLFETDPDNGAPKAQDGVLILQSKLIRSIIFLASDYPTVSALGGILSIRTKHGRSRLEYVSLETNIPPCMLWKARANDVQKGSSSSPRLTSILPIELSHIVLGYSDGLIAHSSFSELVQGKTRRTPDKISDLPLAGYITSMHLVTNEKTGDRRIIGGSDDGAIAIWSYDSLQLLARWTIFLEPLAEVIYIPQGRLRGCTFCISRDGTIAIIAIDGNQFLHLVPASAAPLIRISLGEDNLLLYYADHRVRLWDVKTREFWRSMSTEKADEMLKQGGWSAWPVGLTSTPASKMLTALPAFEQGIDAAATITLDLEAFLLDLGTNALLPAARHSEISTGSTTSVKRDLIRSALSVLLTFSLNEEIDRLCYEKLGIERPNASVGISRHGSTTYFIEEGARGPWMISPEVSAARASSVVALLDALIHHEEGADDARTVSVFYTTSLAQVVGPPYKGPSLAILAWQWLEAKVPEIRSASRLHFEAGISRLLDDEIIQLVDSWQGHLPSLQPEATKDTTHSAMALFICGLIAVEKYMLLQTNHLTDISKSIALYLHDELSPHRALGIDLCSRGFPIWQQYVDAVEILRALFTLATSTRKEAISLQNVGQQARTAILQIASSNTPLFMTTLSMDILQPKNVQHRKSVMQLVIFLIHKKPLALYSNLPRLVEAVVKSLDPNSNASREAVLDSATEILGHVVDTYPTVDFHGPTQRLAVGTSEGALVMYDLKTATRLYVLEGHKKRTTACSFSPDGRRLVTLSLDECMVLVWKVGSSFTSFFNPGAPPRQGHGGSDPYKTFNFNIGEDGVMTILETLEHVRFEWVSDRSVKLQIREVTLTFST